MAAKSQTSTSLVFKSCHAAIDSSTPRAIEEEKASRSLTATRVVADVAQTEYWAYSVAAYFPDFGEL